MHVVVLGHFVTLVGAIEWTLVYAGPDEYANWPRDDGHDVRLWH